MYDQIKTKEDYFSLLNSGMFYEFYPELSGNWEKDKELILKNNNNGKNINHNFSISSNNRAYIQAEA